MCGDVLDESFKKESSLIFVGITLHVIFIFGLGGHYLAKYFSLHVLDNFPQVVMTYTSNLGLMFWATLLRSIFEGKSLSRVGKIWFWFVPILWVVVFPSVGLFGRFYLHNMNAEIIRFPLTAGFVMILFVCVLKLPATSNRFILYLGAISYSIYLFHLVVYVLVCKLISIYFASISPPLAVVLLVMFFLTICFAALVYHFIELPSQRLAKRLTR